MAKTVNGRMQTGPQTIVMIQSAVDQERAILNKELEATYRTYRKMREQPTIALARALSTAPVIGAEWSVESEEGVPDEWVAFIRSQMVPIREPLVQTIMYNRVDYGWAPFELVWGTQDVDGIPRIVVDKYKPLLVDITEILVDQDTGAFAGMRQENQYSSPEVENPLILEPEYCLLVPFEVEGTDWYGRALLENIRPTYIEWIETNRGAARFDKKVAGDHWVIKYPMGTTPVDGVERDNAEIAAEILDTLEASGSVAIPVAVQETMDDLNAAPMPNWEIELKSATAQQGNYVARSQYLDKLFVRGLLTPERTILEGQYGTKAEAGVHTDWSLQQREIEHRWLTRLVNKYVVNRLLLYNFGPDAVGRVGLVAAPLSSDQLTFLRMLYTSMLANPLAASEILEAVDFDAMIDNLGIPKLPDVAESPGGGPVSGVGSGNVQQRMLDALRRLTSIAQNPEAASGAATATA